MSVIASARAATRQQTLAPLLMICAFVLLVPAQFRLQHQDLSLLSGSGLLAALLAWAWSMREAPPPVDELGALADAPPALSPPHWAGLGLTLLAAAVTYARTGVNDVNLAWLVPWLVAVVLWMVVWWPQTAPESAERPRWLLPLLLAATLVGLYLRLHRLEVTPAEPTSDHAEKLMDMTDMLNGRRPLFLERNTGREPLQFYFNLLLMQGFGMSRSYETLKFGTALADTLVIPVTYLLGAELAGRRAGLIAAALYAISKWTISMALIGLRVSYAPLFAGLLVWALLRYMRRGDRRDALLVGLFLGLGLYGYTPFRLVVPVVPLAFLLLLLFDRRWRGVERAPRLVGHGLLAAATSLLVFLPMLHFMQARPDLFWQRASSRLLGDPSVGRVVADSALEALWVQRGLLLENYRNAFLAFNWRGDSTFVNAVRYDPFVDPVTGAALLLGMALLLYQIVRRRSLRYLLVLLALPIMFLASTLSLAFPRENPSVNRMFASAPLIFTIASLSLAALLAQAARLRWRGQPVLAGVALAALLGLATRENYVRFFHDFHAQYRSFVRNTSDAAEAILRSSALGVDPAHAYHVSYPHWFDTRNIGFKLDDPSWAATHEVLPKAPLPISTDGKPMLFLIHRDDQARIAEAQRRWPEGVLARYETEVQHMWFYTFYVPVAAGGTGDGFIQTLSPSYPMPELLRAP